MYKKANKYIHENSKYKYHIHIIEYYNASNYVTQLQYWSISYVIQDSYNTGVLHM